MDNAPAAPPFPVFNPAPAVPVMETVTLAANGAPTALPTADAEALIGAGLASAPVAELEAFVLLADAGGHKAGEVLTMPAALAAQLGERARAATAAEREIAGPNLKTISTL